MAEDPVVNSSPLILLSRAGLIDLLQLAGSHIIVPTPVAEEIRICGSSDPTVVVLDSTDWLTVEDPEPIPSLIAGWDLGPGESSVLAWALSHRGADAILDDLAGRRCARALGIPVRGTLGLVLIAKQRGVIPAARPVLDQLRRHGMYLSDRVINEALARVGE
ncbi:MAG: DUF3368 domain-containing protein [Planctomycetaceae bacterium]|nr:DUF3368 domain-containing protein [Planctomycetaceae bacterium]